MFKLYIVFRKMHTTNCHRPSRWRCLSIDYAMPFNCSIWIKVYCEVNNKVGFQNDKTVT